jgi:hypothetical protein
LKKKFLFIAILAISIIAIFSCRKSFEPQPIPDQKIEASDETETKILEFISSMNDPLKSGSTHTISEAIWYAEATLNYTYAIYDSSFVFLSRDSSTFSIDLTANNTVNHIDLLATYAKMVDSLAAHYNGIQNQTKHVLLCDIIDVSNSVGTLKLILVSVVACDNTNIQWNYFDEDEDYWFSILEWGKCNWLSGDGDAAIRLNLAFMASFCQSDPDVRIWFSDEHTVGGVNPGQAKYEFLQAPRGYRGFYHYGTGTMTNPQCCSPEELEFYMSNDGILYIIENEKPTQPPNLEFEYIDISSWGFSPGIGYWQESHIMDITYGIKNETIVPASNL